MEHHFIQDKLNNHQQSTCLTIIQKDKVISQQNSYFTMMPIHTGNESFITSYTAIKKNIIRPAFGTTSSRQQKIFNGIKQSDIVAYSRINYDQNQKYQDRYQQFKKRNAPFLTTSLRFNSQSIKNPGPGAYTLVDKFKYQSNMQKNNILCPIKYNSIKRNHKQVKKQINTNLDETPGPNHYQFQQQNNKQKIRQMIKKKQQQKKQKIIKMQQMLKRQNSETSKINLKTKNNFYQNKQNQIKSQNFEKKKKICHIKQNEQKSLKLQKITNKYLQKLNYSFEKDQLISANFENYKNFQRMQPIFMSKDNSVYSSYITTNQVPGPGHYLGHQGIGKKKKKLPAKFYEFIDFKI